MLDVAAVLGREVDLARVAAASERTAETVLDELAPALHDGLLDRPRGRVGLRFTHDLVRETLLVELTPAHRARIHHRVAGLLEPLADDPDVTPELAHHALAALPLGDPAAAVGWARRAAEQATAQLAHEEAARLYALAVDAGRTVLSAGERPSCSSRRRTRMRRRTISPPSPTCAPRPPTSPGTPGTRSCSGAPRWCCRESRT